MKIGDTYEKYGAKRLVIGIREDGSIDSTTDLDFFKRPVSASDKGFDLEVKCELLEKKLEKSEEKNSELEKKLEGFSMERDPCDQDKDKILEGEEVINADLTCKFCGKTCNSTAGLSAHLRACEKNPDSHNYKE